MMSFGQSVLCTAVIPGSFMGIGIGIGLSKQMPLWMLSIIGVVCWFAGFVLGGLTLKTIATRK